MSARDRSQLFSSIRGKFSEFGKIPSVFVRNRIAFMLLMVAIAVLKLWYSAVAPASFDLQNMTAILNPTFPNSPWMTLERGIFYSWKLLTASTDADPTKWWLTPPGKMTPNLLLLSLLFRFPAFLSDVAISFVLYLVSAKATRSSELSRFASLVWFLNPYTLFAAELLGVPDVVIALLTTLTLLFLYSKRNLLAIFSLTAGIALKLYPILLVPTIALFVRETKTRRSNIVLLFVSSLIGIIGYLSWLYPYSGAVLSLDYTPVSQPLRLFTISIVPGQIGLVSVTLLVLTFVYLFLWEFLRSAELILTITLTFLAYYLFSSPYPQYFIWVLPFLTLDVVIIRRKRAVILALMMVLIFSLWFIVSHGFATPSGYSLLFPIIGNSVSSEQMVALTNSEFTRAIMIPLLNAGLYAVVLIYAFDVTLRDCFGLVKIEHGC